MTLVQEEAVEVTMEDETITLAATSADPTTIEFAYKIPVQGKVTFTLKKEAIQDDLQRSLPANVEFTRIVGSACGPSYLASLSQNASVCRCRRSYDQCECQCGELGASMQY